MKNNAINKYRTLTPREKEIFLLTAKGRSNKEICEILNIALPTVKMHRANAFDKLDVHSSIEALKMYESLGISGEKDAL
nr:LuxR C-terminal-related transcriptional regulator [Turicimonas muris]